MAHLIVSPSKMANKPQLIFVPLSAIGHLKPTIQLANSLSGHFSITVLLIRPPIPEWNNILTTMTNTAVESINFVNLPSAQPDLTKTNRADLMGTLSQFVQAHIPIIKDTIFSTVQNTSNPIAGIVVDVFATDVADVAKELNLPCYYFFTSSAAYLGVMFYLPTLDSLHTSEMAELDANGVKFNIPTLANPLRPLATSKSLHNKKFDGYRYSVRCAFRLREATGIIFNSSADLEPFAVKAMQNGLCIPDHETPKIYPIGPLMSHDHHQSQRHECLQWLDSQPRGSVVFLCFGSMGSFSEAQSFDVALALEQSGHRFLWCLRSSGKENLMPVDAQIGEMLPEGFLERNKGKGMVWNKWAPQREILAHEAVGGFVSHCGWNSCLESMWSGVPVLAWPMYAEQKFNAFEMVYEMGGVAIELDFAAGNVGEVLEKGLRCLMGDGEEGKKVRERAKEVKMLCRRSVGESGSSEIALRQLVNDLMKGVSGYHQA